MPTTQSILFQISIIGCPKIIYFSSFSSLCALEQRCRIRQLHNLLLPNCRTRSFLSVSKFCAEWHLFTAFNLDDNHKNKIPIKLLPVLKSLTFFAPHTLFRSASLAVMAGYFRFYALIPLSIFIIVSLPVSTYAMEGFITYDGIMATLFGLPFNIFTIATNVPFDKNWRKLLFLPPPPSTAPWDSPTST